MENMINKIIILSIVAAVAIGGVLNMAFDEGIDLSPSTGLVAQADVCTKLAVDIMYKRDVPKNCLYYAVRGCGNSNKFFYC